MAPVLCFTAQDVADELGRTDRRAVRRARRRAHRSTEGEKLGNPNKRWTDEIRPRREAILQPLEAFRAAGHKSLEARVRVTPTAAERPHWQWSLAHLAELCVVSRVELDPADAPAGAETRITVDEAPGPTCPRCWRRTGESAGAGRRRSGPVPALRRRDRRTRDESKRESHHRDRPHPSPSADRKYLLFTIFALISLILDQWTKVWARTHLRPRGSYNPKVVIEGYFDLRYAENPGVAFSMLQDMPGGRVLLTLLAVGAFVLVLYYLRKTPIDRHAAAHRAGARRRRRDRQPHRPRASTAR